MKGKAIYILFAYHFITRSVCDYFDSDALYYFLDAVLIALVGYFVYYHSDNTLRNKLALGGVLLLATLQSVNTLLLIFTDFYINYITELVFVGIAIDIAIIAIKKIFKKT